MTYIAESQILVPSVKQALGTAVLTIDGDIADLLTINASVDTSLDILAGTGQVIRNLTLGSPIYRYITWDAETIPSGQTVGNFIVAVEDSGSGAGTKENPGIGNVIIVDNDNTSDLLPSQAVSKIALGTFNMVGGSIVQVFQAPMLAHKMFVSKYSSDFGLGPYNFEGELGYIITPVVAALQMGISAGSSYSFNAGILDDIETPDVVTRGIRSPTPLIGLGDPVTGEFSFSGTAEVDPTLVSKQGEITAFADAGGGNTLVTSMVHGIVTGDVPTVVNTTNYNDTFNVVAHTGNNFTIDTAFVGDDATGNWSSLTATTLNRFTGQRVFLFPQSGIVAPLYGMAEYLTVAVYDENNGEDSEGFSAPNIVQKGIRVSTLVIAQNISNFGETSLFSLRKAKSRIKT